MLQQRELPGILTRFPFNSKAYYSQETKLRDKDNMNICIWINHKLKLSNNFSNFSAE
jgi:hypothetical protein